MPALLEFCLKLAWKIINILYIEEQEGGGKFMTESILWLMTAPSNVRRYQNRMWIRNAKTAYQYYSCIFKQGKDKELFLMNPKGVDM